MSTTEERARALMEEIGFRVVPIHQKLAALDIPVCDHTYDIIAKLIDQALRFAVVPAPPSRPAEPEEKPCDVGRVAGDWCYAHGQSLWRCQPALKLESSRTAEPRETGRVCFVGMCGKPDVNAPHDGTWPTCSKFVPACAEHLVLVPPPQRRIPVTPFDHKFMKYHFTDQPNCFYCGASKEAHEEPSRPASQPIPLENAKAFQAALLILRSDCHHNLSSAARCADCIADVILTECKAVAEEAERESAEITRQRDEAKAALQEAHKAGAKAHHMLAWHECPTCVRWFQQDEDGAVENARLQSEMAALAQKAQEAERLTIDEYKRQSDMLREELGARVQAHVIATEALDRLRAESSASDQKAQAEGRVSERARIEGLVYDLQCKWKRNANATAAAGEGDLGSIEAATCLDAQANAAHLILAALRALPSAPATEPAKEKA